MMHSPCGGGSMDSDWGAGRIHRWCNVCGKFFSQNYVYKENGDISGNFPYDESCEKCRKSLKEGE